MDIDELKGIEVDLITVKGIVTRKHALSWLEWVESTDKPEPDAHGMYDLFDVYVWLGY